MDKYTETTDTNQAVVGSGTDQLGFQFQNAWTVSGPPLRLRAWYTISVQSDCVNPCLLLDLYPKSGQREASQTAGGLGRGSRTEGIGRYLMPKEMCSLCLLISNG